MLSGVNGASPWAVDASESGAYLVEVALGRHSSGLIAEWSPSDEFDHDIAVSSMPEHPNVWTDGSLVLDRVTGVSSSGAVFFFAHQSQNCRSYRRWGHVEDFRIDPNVPSCRGFCSVPGPLQSVQRAEMWGVVLALQSSRVRLGVDNLGVVRHVGRLLDGHCGFAPFELVNDGDLLLLVESMLHLGGLDTVRITKVKGHADQSMVLDGRVRELDRLGNNAAYEAADFGCWRVGNAVIDARNLSGVCGRCTLSFLTFIVFFIAISRAVVNHHGRDGTAPDPLVWSAGALPERRRLVHAVRDRAFCPGHLVFGTRNSFNFLHLLFALRTLLLGLIPLVSWLSGSLS